MKLLYIAENIVEAQMIIIAMKSEGVSIHMENEYLQQGFGDIAGMSTMPHLYLVEDEDKEIAIAALERMGKKYSEFKENDWLESVAEKYAGVIWKVCLTILIIVGLVIAVYMLK